MLDDSVFLEAWAQTKSFIHPAESKKTAFFDNSAVHQQFMEEDLAASGLKPLHMNAFLPKLMMLKKHLAAYVIPYYNVDGTPIADSQGKLAMWRAKLKIPAMSKDDKYDQPNKDDMAPLGLPASFPYIHPLTLRLPSDTLVCAEGEKKTVSVIKHLGLPTFGIGGCFMWRNPNGNGDIHPWIRALLEARKCKKILIIPDGDLLRYDICNAYGTFAHCLVQAGYTVEICNPPGKIDDLFKEWGSESEVNFADIPRIKPDELVQSSAMLASRYNLAFSKTGKDQQTIRVHQTTANVMKLMEEHPSFPKVWRNLDDNRIYVGEVQAQPDLTEMEIANYFQYNLGFEKVTHRIIYSCIQALAKKNRKSPFLDWVKGLSWDGTERLAQWITNYWGVSLTPYLSEVATKWLVGACARMDRPGTKVDWMMIVVGPQGVGKTSMPSVLFKGNSATLYGDYNDKDLHMKIHSALAIGFDELDSFGKRETSFLKAMVTTSQDHFRPPYGASVEVFDRRCTLYGCGNRHEFLQADPSGYRRYAIVEVKQKLDFQGLEESVDQLWAEAWHIYSKGNTEYWEVTGASAEAQKYVVPSDVEEEVKDYIEKLKANATNCRQGFAFLKYSLMLRSLQVRANPREVAAILRNLGGEKRKCRGPQAGSSVGDWWLIPLDEACNTTDQPHTQDTCEELRTLRQ